MFDFKDTIEKKNSPDMMKSQSQPTEEEVLLNQESEEDLANQTKPVDIQKITSEMGDVKVHAMPTKFLANGHVSVAPGKSKSGSKKTSLKKNIILGLGIGLGIVIIIGLGAWFLLKSVETPVKVAPVVQDQPQDQQPVEEQTLPVEEEQPQEVVPACSELNCELCDMQNCLSMTDACHLEDQCKIYGQEDQGSCPDYICVSGPQPEEIDEKRPEDSEPDIILTPGVDSDNDLLTDVEEELWGSDPYNVDTDKDGYEDGSELLNFYDPTKTGVGVSSLENTKAVDIFTDSITGYSVYYPAAWKFSRQVNGAMFSSLTGEFIQIIVEDNTSEILNAKQWYMDQNFSVREEDLEEVLIGNWVGVKSPDGLNVYLMISDYIYTIAYNVGLKEVVNYSTTFEMMLKSFKIFESPNN